MNAEQKIERVMTWLNSYPQFDDPMGDLELTIVQKVRRLVETEVPVELVQAGQVGWHVEGCTCLVSDGAVLNVDSRCNIP